MATSPTEVKDLIKQSVKSTAEYRESVLNKKPHFVPISEQALAITVKDIIASSIDDLEDDMKPTKDFPKEAYDKILANFTTDVPAFAKKLTDYAEKSLSNKIHISRIGGSLKILINGKESTADVIINSLPARIYSNNKFIGLLYISYNSLQENLFRKFLNVEMKDYINKKLYTAAKTKYTPGFDPGHVMELNSGIAKSPIGERLLALQATLNTALSFQSVIASPTNTTIVQDILNTVEDAIKDLSNAGRFGPQIILTLDKDIQDVLQQIEANVVVVQDTLQNRFDFGTLVESKWGTLIFNALKKVNFSKNLEEEIEYRAFEPLRSNKKPGTYKKKAPVQKDKVLGSKNNITLSKPKVALVPKVKTRVKSTLTITNLPMLMLQINANLHDQIKRNMGTASRQDVLNYRTGRFAQSARVQRLSESRQGMITAFYSYMKNPYATFSRGGRQDRPYTRDPKLLISKSIRELAGAQVANRMRAVLV